VRRAPWLAVGAALTLLPALPIASWVRAPDPGPPWGLNVQAWLLGVPIVVLLAVLAGRLAVNLRVKLPAITPRHRVALLGGLAAALVALATFVAQWAFAANPQLVDEMAQLFQARAFLAGRLAAPAPEHPEFFLFLHTWITPAGWVSQFPPGHAALLAVGMLARAEWLVNPALGGLSLLLVYALARKWYGPRIALIAAVLWAASGWVVAMSATYMNHASAALFALAAWVLALGHRKPRAVRLALAGLALAAIGVTRPLDAAAAAMPVAAGLLSRRPWRALAAVAAGTVPLLLVLAYVNWRLYGHPLQFGYGAFHGEEQRLGFHVDPFGHAFTPLVALSNLAVAVRRLHIYLFEWPLPALLPLAVWALAARHRHRSDLLLVTGIAAVPALYFFYWHSGFYPGPRYYYLLAPLLVIATARAAVWGWKRVRRFPRGIVRWDVAYAAAGIVVVVWSAAALLPARMRAYRAEHPVLKLRPERWLAREGVSQAVVLVPESWGSRVVVDLWTLGVAPGLVERSYRRIDTCELYELADQARRERRPPEWIAAALEAMTAAAQGPAPPVPGWPDPTLRLRGAPETLPLACRVEMRRDLQGFTPYGPLAWRNTVGLQSGIVFARDLFERNALLLEDYEGWEVWRYAPPAGDPDGLPALSRVRPASRAPAGGGR